MYEENELIEESWIKQVNEMLQEVWAEEDFQREEIF